MKYKVKTNKGRTTSGAMSFATASAFVAALGRRGKKAMIILSLIIFVVVVGRGQNYEFTVQSVASSTESGDEDIRPSPVSPKIYKFIDAGDGVYNLRVPDRGPVKYRKIGELPDRIIFFKKDKSAVIKFVLYKDEAAGDIVFATISRDDENKVLYLFID